jgi:hypothetical protein
MQALKLRWPRVRPLVELLQSPAHRVIRVLGVTQANWAVPERRVHVGASAHLHLRSPA